MKNLFWRIQKNNYCTTLFFLILATLFAFLFFRLVPGSSPNISLIYTLLLIVPGIIRAISYSLVPYILAKGTDASASEVLDLSAKMMNGHKMDYFILNLSYLLLFKYINKDNKTN